MALRIPAWLQDGKFERFQPERAEDVDVWFDGERHRDHHQEKDESLTPSKAKKLIHDFRSRNAVLIAKGVVRRFIIAWQFLSNQLRGFAGSLEIHRKRHFGPGDERERQDSERALRDRAERLGLGEQFDFILGHVSFDTDLAGLDREDGHPRDLLMLKLLPFLGIDGVSEATYVADVLLARLHEDRTRLWSRAELLELIRRAREEYRTGPPPCTARGSCRVDPAAAAPHRLLEHDLDSGRFRWRQMPAVTGATVQSTRVGSGRVARLRVSASAMVCEEQCNAVLPHENLRMDIHLQAEDLGCGTVGNEAQARSYASAIRRALDTEIAGNPDINALHLFAAVPVSVAFLLGQVLAYAALPPSTSTTSTPVTRRRAAGTCLCKRLWRAQHASRF